MKNDLEKNTLASPAFKIASNNCFTKKSDDDFLNNDSLDSSVHCPCNSPVRKLLPSSRINFFVWDCSKVWNQPGLADSVESDSNCFRQKKIFFIENANASIQQGALKIEAADKNADVLTEKALYENLQPEKMIEEDETKPALVDKAQAKSNQAKSEESELDSQSVMSVTNPSSEDSSPKNNAKEGALSPLNFQNSEPSINFKLVHLQRLFNFFEKMFSNGAVDASDYNLSDKEEEILYSLMSRKYYYNPKRLSNGIEAEAKVNKINEIISSRSNKRSEECYKFILTRLMKSLKRAFAFERPALANQEEEFYKFYFGEEALKQNLDICSFHYPLNKKSNGQIKLNSNFFEKLFGSQRFFEATSNYLKSQLYADCRREVRKKLRALFGKYDLMLRRNPSNKEKIIEELKEYFRKNQRCKMPWTVREVEEAVARFYTLLSQNKK